MPESLILIMLSMVNRHEITLENQYGVLLSGIVNSIEAEDGSGTGFTINLNNSNSCYIKRPIGTGTIKDPIKSNLRTGEAYGRG